MNGNADERGRSNDRLNSCRARFARRNTLLIHHYDMLCQKQTESE